MTEFYILDGTLPKSVDTVQEWAAWFEHNARHVGKTDVGVLWVSTVFLGIDHSQGYGKPILFETMIYNNAMKEWMDYQTRCATWEEAIEMHSKGIDFAERVLRARKSMFKP